MTKAILPLEHSFSLNLCFKTIRVCFKHLRKMCMVLVGLHVLNTHHAHTCKEKVALFPVANTPPFGSVLRVLRTE